MSYDLLYFGGEYGFDLKLKLKVHAEVNRWPL